MATNLKLICISLRAIGIIIICRVCFIGTAANISIFRGVFSVADAMNQPIGSAATYAFSRIPSITRRVVA